MGLTTGRRQSLQVPWLALVLGLAFLVVDLETPFGVIGAFPYVLPVLLGLWAPWPTFSLWAAAVFSGFTLLGAWLSPPGPAVTVGIINRALSLAMIWAIAVVVYRDKLLQSETDEAREASQAYLDVAGVIILVLDREGRIQLLNRKGHDVLREEPDAPVERSWFDHYVPDAQRDVARRLHARNFDASQPPLEYFEGTVRTRTGEERTIAWRNTRLRDAEGEITGILASGEDITEHRRAEEALELARTRLRLVLGSAPIMLWAVDDQGTLTLAEGRAREALSSDQELVGRRLAEIYSSVPWLQTGFRRALEGKLERLVGEMEGRWLETRFTPLRGPDGGVEGATAVAVDITERREFEDQLSKQAALAHLGQMAAVVAHEVKNPLAGIAGAVGIIGSRLPTASPDRQVIGSILNRIDSLNAMVNDLLLFARPRTPSFSSISVRAVLSDAAVTLQQDPKLHGIRIELSGTDPTVRGDPNLLKEVFLNLLLNAAQASPGQNVLARVTTTEKQCCITIEDRGPGVSPEHIPYVFEPFFTTKSRGTGLGLAISKRIVEAHAGAIDLDTSPGKGTRVSVCLPRDPVRAPFSSDPLVPQTQVRVGDFPQRPAD